MRVMRARSMTKKKTSTQMILFLGSSSVGVSTSRTAKAVKTIAEPEWRKSENRVRDFSTLLRNSVPEV